MGLAVGIMAKFAIYAIVLRDEGRSRRPCGLVVECAGSCFPARRLVRIVLVDGGRS